MCFYEQYIYECRDWKWGNFRSHCDNRYRMGETCGMKMVHQRISLTEKCKLCLKIEAKERRRAKHVDDYNRWRKKPSAFPASIEKAIHDIKALESDITQLKSERHRYPGIRYSQGYTGLGRRGDGDVGAPSSLTLDEPQPTTMYRLVDGVNKGPNGAECPQLDRVPSPASSMHSQASSILSKASFAYSDFSMASSTTSAGIHGSIARHAHMIDNIAKSLFCTEELKPVLDSACEDFQIGAERLQKNARRLIQHFGKDLRSEVSDKIQLDVAKAMKTPKLSSYAAQSMMGHVQGSFPKSTSVQAPQTGPNEDMDPDFNDDSSDALDEDDEEELWSTEYRYIHEFLYHSEAYSIFKAQLLDFVHKPYEKRILSAIGSDVVGPAGIRLGKDVIHCMAQEISWVPMHALLFSQDVGKPYGDTLKAFVEDHLGESWNWWPLAPRIHGLRPGYCRLQWKSPCGTPRYVDLPESVKDTVQQAIKTAPAFINIGFPSNTRAHASCGNGSSSPCIGGSPPAGPQLGSGGITPGQTPQGFSAPSQQISKPPPVASPGSNTAAQTAPTRHVDQHLSLCVVSSSRRFISLRCDTLRSDLEFFARMKADYDKNRGRLRLWFSMWRYKCSEFVEFHKYGYRRGARVDVGFPDINDQMYHFLPRKPTPPPPNGPVTKEQFQDHYYLPHCPCLYDWKSYQLRCKGHASKANRVALDAVPKRLERIDMDDGLDEHFYGLYAKEERSFLRVAIYAFLCNLPGVIFFFLWLFQWQHASDLQNASVPLTLSLSLTLGFAAVVFGTRDGD